MFQIIIGDGPVRNVGETIQSLEPKVAGDHPRRVAAPRPRRAAQHTVVVAFEDVRVLRVRGILLEIGSVAADAGAWIKVRAGQTQVRCVPGLTWSHVPDAMELAALDVTHAVFTRFEDQNAGACVGETGGTKRT